ncbi:hypothetical protein [Brasilonema octagenarum]|uniref:Uncharacterized protein n=1 Tax=Brasilonema octagenarum UFV-OR1 TaxID=417115 RepID=A0ABX1M891_9CYAN|nr:hypothetical protein [Brasilonema octagenarum]NMF64777.1 hypothetical protein [Brasilonema octagenarum UFV-OR1]
MTENTIITNVLEKVNDQLVVGDWVIKMNSPHGASVNIATEEEKPTLRLHSTPLILHQPFDFAQGKPSDNFLDRQELVKEAIATFQAGQSVEFYSPSGFGKTVLLRHLEHNPQVKSLFAAGVISLSPVHPNVGDLLQFIWDAFYESNIPYKPTPQQIYQQLHTKQALVVLDDDPLIQDELQELINLVPNCTFLVASSTSRIKKKGRSMKLSGLPMNDALVLMQRELQRPLNIEEQEKAKSLYKILDGQPMRLRIVMASIHQQRRSLLEVVSQLPTSASSNYLLQQIIASLSTSEKTILELLTIMGGVGLDNQKITEITQISDASDKLEKLRKHHLVQLDGSRYKVTKTIVEILPLESKLTASLENAIAYFVNWTERHQQQPNILLAEIDAIAQILEVAVRNSRWQDILRLVKVVEGTLALTKQWGLWEQVLQRGLQASQAEKDRSVQAWILHQLGTRALCLEENSTAYNYLTKAIQLRESLDDDMGVAATRHNLKLLNQSSSSQTHASQQKNIGTNIADQIVGEEDTKLQPPPAPHLVTRMNIVLPDNNIHSNKTASKKVLLSSTKIITTGILAAGGLFAFFHWYRVTPSQPPKSTSKPTTTVKPSPVPKQEPTVTATPLPIVEPPSTIITAPSPLPQRTIKVSPPLTPDLQDEQPIVPKRQKSKIKPTTAPTKSDTPTFTKPTTAPATSDAPTFTKPTPDVTTVPTPTLQATPTPSVTPSVTPNVEKNQPTVEPTPTPTFTPIPTPTPTSQVEATPTPAVTITPIEQAPKSMIENNTELKTENTQ